MKGIIDKHEPLEPIEYVILAIAVITSILLLITEI